MSEERLSPDSDEARRNARKNILHAIGSSRTQSSTLSTQYQHSKDDVVGTTQERQQQAFGARAFQLDTRSHSTEIQPPAPKPRSPRQSPTSR